jgi:hypothetical protein
MSVRTYGMHPCDTPRQNQIIANPCRKDIANLGRRAEVVERLDTRQPCGAALPRRNKFPCDETLLRLRRQIPETDAA